MTASLPLGLVPGSEEGAEAGALRFSGQRLNHGGRIRLGEPEPQLKELIAALDQHAIVSIADGSGRIIYVNDLFCRISGYSAAELLGSLHNIVKSGSHPPEFYRELWDTITAGQVWHGDIQNRRKDGSLYWVATTVMPVLDANDLPVRYVSIRTDISAEKALGEELRRQRAFLADITDAVGEGILVENALGECVFANREAACLLGHPTGTLHGRRLYGEIVDSLDGDTDAPGAARPSNWPSGSYEGQLRMFDGSSRSMLINVQRMPPTGGDCSGRVITFRDHSLERQRRDALREALVAADMASRAKSAFLANVSHEIRTPLNGVLGLARLAADEATPPALRRQYLEGIVESASALADLLSDVLDISKIEAGELKIERVDFALHDLLHAITRSFREAASAKGLALELTIASDVPAFVCGDPVHLRQVLSNYVANAIKFTPSGSVKLVVEAKEAGVIRFAVVDTGIGIDPAVLGRLFRPFTQADESTTRRFGGTGLGLSICRELASHMGGRTGAESTPGSGSAFWAELPLPAAAAPAPEARGSAAARHVDDLTGVQVLLVEDNEINTLVATALLSKWGVEVVSVQSGGEALDVVTRERGAFDLVFMDLHMPGMSGLETARALRSRYTEEELPIVALTASAFEEDRVQSRLAGMNDFLAKPFNEANLHATVLKWISMRCRRTSAA